jgi:hypothetical protein
MSWQSFTRTGNDCTRPIHLIFNYEVCAYHSLHHDRTAIALCNVQLTLTIKLTNLFSKKKEVLRSTTRSF